jgi:hypothetical protein
LSNSLQKKRLQRREELRREEEALSRKRKEEEKDRWWSGAELHVSPSNQNKEEHDNNNLTPQEANKRDKYSANYSRWDEWIPQDPATLQEVTSFSLCHSISRSLTLSSLTCFLLSGL